MIAWTLIRCGKLHATKITPADSIPYVDSMNRQAHHYQPRQLDTCYKYLSRAMETARRTGYRRGEAAAFRGLGNYYGYRDNSYLSFRFYLDALRLYKELKDSAGICQVCTFLGAYYKYEGKSEEADRYIQDAMNIARVLKNDTLNASVLTYYHFIYRDDEQHKTEALQALADARRMSRACGDERLVFYTGFLEADRLLDEGQATSAIQLVDSLVKAAEAEGLNFHAMYGYFQLADYKSIRLEADSLQALKEIVRLAIAGGYREIALPVVTELHAYYQERNLNKEAAIYGAMMADIVEQQEVSNVQGELDYIDYYMQGRKLRALQLQNDYQRQLLDKKALGSRKRYIVIVCLVALLVVTVLILADLNRSYRRSRKNARRLGEKNREISEKNALLRSNDDFKNKLISLIAHDFRSPLNNIIYVTMLLKDESLSYEEAAALFRKLEGNSKYTLQVFDNILRWIRSQLSGFVYTPQDCTLKELINDAMESLKDNCADKQLEIRMQVPEELRLQADREMLQFIHRNLLHNAVKFSPQNGVITITAASTAQSVKVTVKDEGHGIAPEMLSSLFEYRSRNNNKKHGGAGLALIICKDFMDKMGGDIEAMNNPEKGSSFSYTLPLSRHQYN